jgi:hypothetical protein
MIEILVENYLLNDKEHFNSSMFSISFNYIIFFIISIVAAILSWRCNTISDYPFTIKLVCAINAFSFGIVYLLFYGFLYMNDKNFCNKKKY